MSGILDAGFDFSMTIFEVEKTVTLCADGMEVVEHLAHTGDSDHFKCC